jgi:putative mycofactocin binding protein MftB
VLSAPLVLSPHVALRPEPFGALAYHYGNRRLSFLRSPELVTLVRSLGDHPGTDAALAASGIDARRWPAFRSALASLLAAEVLCERPVPPPPGQT